VRCVTSPVNTESIRFHQRMGFQPEGSARTADGVPMVLDYDGKGEDRVLFTRQVTPVQRATNGLFKA